jgi:hypothetical protein
MKRTRLAIVPLILAIITILPPFPNLTICFAAACAVMKHPVTFTLSIVSQSFPEYSNAGVSCWMPAAAMRPSSRPCLEAMELTILLRFSTSRTSMRW